MASRLSNETVIKCELTTTTIASRLKAKVPLTSSRDGYRTSLGKPVVFPSEAKPPKTKKYHDRSPRANAIRGSPNDRHVGHLPPLHMSTPPGVSFARRTASFNGHSGFSVGGGDGGGSSGSRAEGAGGVWRQARGFPLYRTFACMQVEMLAEVQQLCSVVTSNNAHHGHDIRGCCAPSGVVEGCSSVEHWESRGFRRRSRVYNHQGAVDSRRSRRCFCAKRACLSTGCIFVEWVCGYHDMVLWRSNGCPWDQGTCSSAAERGHL